ncbi:MAG: hypothetical protein H7833_15945 [Magnetococcus sp. DMHC-1]|nr:hypothetical protein [Magnetococcales bacterium]
MEPATNHRHLVSIWQHLAAPERKTLLQFAEFLLEKSRENMEPEPTLPVEPLDIPAPAGESAVKALKRLKKTYPMIETDFSLLEKASQILMEKVLGTPDKEVIEKMEDLFREQHQRWRAARQGQ